MRASSDLGDDASESGVLLNLAVHFRREHFAPAAYDGRGCFVAGGLDPEDEAFH